MFGKWHLGDTPGRLPIDQGFDEWYGIPNTTDEALYTSHPKFDPKVGHVPHIMEGLRGQKAKVVEEYTVAARREIDGELTRRAIDFMKRQRRAKKPFFAFVPFTQAHLPTLPDPDFDKKTGNGHYADVLAEIDHRAGQILDAIDKLGIRDNTIVIWTSDNGPEEIAGSHGTAGFWRGHYFTALEGSLRTSFLIRFDQSRSNGGVGLAGARGTSGQVPKVAQERTANQARYARPVRSPKCRTVKGPVGRPKTADELQPDVQYIASRSGIHRCRKLIGIPGHVINGPLAAHSSEGLVLAADGAEVRPVHPFLRVAAMIASAIVQKPLAKASQRARFSEGLLRHLWAGRSPSITAIFVRVAFRVRLLAARSRNEGIASVCGHAESAGFG